MSGSRKVLIIEDHPLFREALVTALSKAFPEDAVAIEVDSIASGIGQISNQQPDLILLDLNVTDASGFDGLTKLKTESPDCPVYIVTATEGSDAINKARTLGASGYLPKSLSLEDLSAALATALDGGSWFPETNGLSTLGDTDDAANRIATLTPAQRRVLSGLSDGLLNKQIAFDMGISEATVKAHMTAIFRKLGANNRTQALLIYKQAVSVSGTDHSAA